MVKVYVLSPDREQVTDAHQNSYNQKRPTIQNVESMDQLELMHCCWEHKQYNRFEYLFGNF